MEHVGGGDAAAGPVAGASYVSTQAIIEREARALALDLRRHPHFWFPFVRARLVRLAGYAILVVLVAVAVPVPTGPVVLAAALVFAAWTAVAARTWLAEPYRICLAYCEDGCPPPGTLVRATYAARAFEFVLPDRTITVDPATVVAARRRAGCLLVDLADTIGPMCVPDELLGPDGLRVVRTVLGDRLLEG